MNDEKIVKSVLFLIKAKSISFNDSTCKNGSIDSIHIVVCAMHLKEHKNLIYFPAFINCIESFIH